MSLARVRALRLAGHPIEEAARLALAESEDERPGPVPDEALRYFESKGLRPSFNHDEVWAEEHAYAFTVAKVMEVDILEDLQDSVADALRNGLTFKQWAAQTKDVFDRSGWSAYAKGREKPHRLFTIYKTNMRTARAAGQWDRIERTKKTHPNLLYALGPAVRHRPEHVDLEGTLLPADDPFWDAYYPPNGWGCVCHVIQLSAPATERRGGETERPRVELREVVRPTKGTVDLVPKGVHASFNYNFGKHRAYTTRQRLLERRAERSAPGPTAQHPDAGSMFRSLIREGKLSSTQVFDRVSKQFGLTDNKKDYVAWYKRDVGQTLNEADLKALSRLEQRPTLAPVRSPSRKPLSVKETKEEIRKLKEAS
jgi:hypothetical protein